MAQQSVGLLAIRNKGANAATVTWVPPPDSQNGSTVDTYKVYKATSFDGPYTLEVTLQSDAAHKSVAGKPGPVGAYEITDLDTFVGSTTGEAWVTVSWTLGGSQQESSQSYPIQVLPEDIDWSSNMMDARAEAPLQAIFTYGWDVLRQRLRRVWAPARIMEIINVPLANAGTEYEVSIPKGTQTFTLKSRDATAVLQFSDESGASGTRYITIAANTSYYEQHVQSEGVIFYVQSDTSSDTAEVVIWK